MRAAFLKARVRAGAAIMVIPLSTAAMAQSQQPSPISAGDIVVTAQRRTERLRDVPISATVLGGAALAQRQIKDVRSLYGSVPSLSITTGLGENHGLFIGLRGLNVQASQIGSDPAVGVYIDGLYLARTTGVDVALVDIERLEVLRGPQGILFGRNTIGGAFNITTVKPKDQFGGYVRLEAGNYDRTELTGVINIPVTSDLSTRFVYRRERDSGYVKSALTGDRFGDGDYDYARASIRYAPSDKFEALVTSDYYNSDAHSAPYKLLTYRTSNPGGGAQAIALANGDTLANYVGGSALVNDANYDPRYPQRFYSVTGTLTGNLGWATLKSITGYRRLRSTRSADLDGTPYDIYAFENGENPQNQFSQEIQAYGDTLQNRLHWIIGGYYFQETGAALATTLQNYSITPPVSLGQFHVDLLDARNTSLSTFGQLSFDVTDKLQLTGGLRYVRDSREAGASFRSVNGVTGAVTCYLPTPSAANPDNVLPNFDPEACTASLPKVRFHYVPWSVGLKYKIADKAMVYGKVTRGYRSGGYPNPTGSNVTADLAFLPETTLTYEVGSKVTIFDNHLDLNLSAYRTSYENIQQPIVGVGVGGVLVQAVQNVGSARIWGGEAEATLRLGKLRLDGGLGIVDPKYTKGPLVGFPFLNTSKQTWSIAGNYPIATGIGDLDLNASYAYRSKTSFSTPVGLTPAEVRAVTQKAVGLLNVSATLALHNKIKLELWARNLTDVHYYSYVFNAAASAGITAGAVATPRTFGGAVTYAF